MSHWLLAGLGPNEAKEKPYIASMGIYVFKKEVLTKLLGDKYPQVSGCEPVTRQCAYHCLTRNKEKQLRLRLSLCGRSRYRQPREVS
jgi:hypothetical protein